MKIRVLSPIRNTTFSFSEFDLYRSIKIIDGALLDTKITLSKAFKETIGKRNMELLKAHYLFFFEGEATDILDSKIYSNIGDMTIQLGDFFSHFVDMFWYIKDNSSFSNQCFIESLYNQNTGIVNDSAVLCNSQDKQEISHFCEEEILEIKDFFEHKRCISTIYNKELDAAKHARIKNSKGIVPVIGNFMNYNQDRLFRALQFLGLARKNGRIITKITFYIALFECLFTSDDHKISKKIRERASSFVGGKGKTRKEYKQTIFKAYDIRSRYIHGDVIDINIDDLLQTSKEMDDLTRIILIKILTMNDNNVFIYPSTEENKIKFEQYFDNLVSVTVAADFKLKNPTLLPPCVVSKVLFT